MRIAYFDCFAGISGDMALGALLDAGARLEDLIAELGKLKIEGWRVEAAKTSRRGISATDITVDCGDGPQPARRFAEIAGLITTSGLSDGVKNGSVGIFRRLGEAEAKVHGKHIDEIHFHEVGAVDAIVDIVGVCVCLELLGIQQVYASPIPTFHGSVEAAHGMLPLPAPAVVELLKEAPWRDLGVEGEIVTPTGAAILAELAASFGPMPAMRIEAVGYGAGKKDFGIPNVLRVMVGETLPVQDETVDTQSLLSG
ncbi:MAG: nickel pincer cofactor biosynthesis protein LarC, partial [Armatimonadota bacterium]